MTPPRFALAVLPTPLVRAPRLEDALGAGPVYLKRDDLTGFGIAGNKARALEFLLGDALAERADVLVAAGSTSSNFCAAAAMAARVAGLGCDLLFPGDPAAPGSVNVELARAAGARLVFGAARTRDGLDAAVGEHAEALRAEGRRPYAVPRGGATAVGALGYAHAVDEVSEQCEAAGVRPRTVVVATGSGGTQAGLVAGGAGARDRWRLVGASVSRPAEEVTEQVLRTARACAERAGLSPPCPEAVEVVDCRGEGFGIASAEDRASARLALDHEGLVLDHYYGAKAMTLLRSLVREPDSTPALFWSTGGVAAALTSLARGAW